MEQRAVASVDPKPPLGLSADKGQMINYREDPGREQKAGSSSSFASTKISEIVPSGFLHKQLDVTVRA